jgi:AcrR family transcriptional regulator
MPITTSSTFVMYPHAHKSKSAISVKPLPLVASAAVPAQPTAAPEPDDAREVGPAKEPARRGRKLDPSRSPAILEATLDELMACGYEGATVQAVAARAGASTATLYRRWPTKEDLVLAAIASLGTPPEADELPDTGQLRTDLLAVIESAWLGGAERRTQVFAGLSSVLTSSPRLATAIYAQITEPYAAAYRALLHRARERGEIPPGRDLDLLAELVPAMSTYRLMFTAGPPDARFLEAVVDHAVLPALGLEPG